MNHRERATRWLDNATNQAMTDDLQAATYAATFATACAVLALLDQLDDIAGRFSFRAASETSAPLANGSSITAGITTASTADVPRRDLHERENTQRDHRSPSDAGEPR